MKSRKVPEDNANVDARDALINLLSQICTVNIINYYTRELNFYQTIEVYTFHYTYV